MSGFFWLASYPKSGNTWLRLALQSVQRGGEAPDFSEKAGFAPIASARQSFDDSLGVESSDLTDEEILLLRPRFYETQAAQAAAPLLRKVHDAWILTPAGEPLFPPAVTLGTVYLVRDPRDIVASLANHNGTSLDEAVASLGNPATIIGHTDSRLAEQLAQRLLSWSGHVSSWLDSPVAPLMLRYEDMLAKPQAVLRRVVDFLGWQAEDAVLARALTATRFEALRAAEDQHGFRERTYRSHRFFRRGQSGGWQHELDAAQVARIEADHGAVMRRLGYL